MSGNDVNKSDDEEKSFFVNSEGLKIYCKYWYPQQSGDTEGLRYEWCLWRGNYARAQATFAPVRVIPVHLGGNDFL